MVPPSICSHIPQTLEPFGVSALSSPCLPCLYPHPCLTPLTLSAGYSILSSEYLWNMFISFPFYCHSIILSGFKARLFLLTAKLSNVEEVDKIRHHDWIFSPSVLCTYCEVCRIIIHILWLRKHVEVL